MNADKQAVFDAAATLTGMRNLAALTSQMVEVVTSELHCSNWLEPDLVSQTFSANCEDFRNGAVTLNVRFRKVWRVYVKTPQGVKRCKLYSNLGDYIESAEPHKAYQVGATLTVGVPESQTSFYIEGFKYVDVSDAGYDSWMERDYPGVVSQEVAARVLASVGDASYQIHRANAKQSYLRMVGGGVSILTPEI